MDKIKKEIRNIIREYINEIYDFQSDAAKFELPRKGTDDSINDFNQVNAQKEKGETQKDREKEIENNFNSPTLNNSTAPTLTNIYEDATVNLDAQVTQDNLDNVNEPNPFPNKNNSKDNVVKFFNSNIDIALNKVKYPGDTENMLPSINKF
jgi:hypothetical protein